MVELFHYTQEKIGKNKQSRSFCDLNLKSDIESIQYCGDFIFDNATKIDRGQIRFSHKLLINISSGDIEITYKIENIKEDFGEPVKSTYWVEKNHFLKLQNLTLMGFLYGEKIPGFWGVKYFRATTEIFNKIKLILFENIQESYILNKTYDPYKISPLYDLIVDYHLYKNNIKGHDNVYMHILEEYPKKKWLTKNDNKFLPAILDRYGIKTKYFVSELSLPENEVLNIKTLVYLCRLFGDNYIEYIKELNWNKICKSRFVPQKYHECKTDAEKKCVLTTIKNWNKISVRSDLPVETLYELFKVREFLDSNGYNLKIKVKTVKEVFDQMEEWNVIKKQIVKGYLLKYSIPDDIVNEIEQPIIIENDEYIPKVLLSEDQFILEGYRMKNCMGRQFTNAAIYWFISLSIGKLTVNLQFKQGVLMVGYGKANTPIDHSIFDAPIDILTERLEKYQNLTWERVKIQYTTKNLEI